MFIHNSSTKGTGTRTFRTDCSLVVDLTDIVIEEHQQLHDGEDELLEREVNAALKSIKPASFKINETPAYDTNLSYSK